MRDNGAEHYHELPGDPALAPNDPNRAADESGGLRLDQLTGDYAADENEEWA